MKQIKLELGKTYRSRKGKEVGIVRAIYSRIWPFCGDNGKSYNEQGRRYSVNLDDSEDLIEEVPETTRHTFVIPDGVKEITLSYEGKSLVVEMVPEKEPKPGDVCINELGAIYIFESIFNSISHKCAYWVDNNGLRIVGGACQPGRPATPEEAQPLWDALKKAGKKWNAETMQVEDVPEIDRIREWAKKHYSNHQSIAEATEAYLKYIGGK